MKALTQASHAIQMANDNDVLLELCRIPEMIEIVLENCTESDIEGFRQRLVAKLTRKRAIKTDVTTCQVLDDILNYLKEGT